MNTGIGKHNKNDAGTDTHDMRDMNTQDMLGVINDRQHTNEIGVDTRDMICTMNTGTNTVHNMAHSERHKSTHFGDIGVCEASVEDMRETRDMPHNTHTQEIRFLGQTWSMTSAMETQS